MMFSIACKGIGSTLIVELRLVLKLLTELAVFEKLKSLERQKSNFRK